MKDWIPYLKNKYIITIIAFIIWMLFFDHNDFIYQYKLGSELSDLKEEKSFYLEKIEEIKDINEEVFADKESLEKFAREKYLMKKDNEDIFLIVRKDD